MGTIRGVDCKIYLNTGTYATPTWTEWTSIVNATLNMEVGEFDASRRGSGAWRERGTTLRDISVDGECIKDKDDTTFVAIESSVQSNASVELLIMDGDRTSANSDGVRGLFRALSWNEGQELEEGVSIDFNFRPYPNTDSPPAFVSGPIS